MSAQRPGGLSREQAEHLLTGGAATSPPGHDPLADVLAAAAAPATANELAGEPAVMRAFAQARHRPVVAPENQLGFLTRLVRIFSTKVATIALLGSVAGGAALVVAGAVFQPFGGPAGDGAPSPVAPSQTPAPAQPGAELPSPDPTPAPGLVPGVVPTPVPSLLPSISPTVPVDELPTLPVPVPSAPLIEPPEQLPSPPSVTVPSLVPTLPALPIHPSPGLVTSSE